MWRGGLSGPNSVFVHASLPLISRDGTSPLLHELMHATLGISPGPGGDWIVEGLAEVYSLELLVRSRTLSKKRYQRVLAQIAERGRAAQTLEVEHSSGATTARAVTMLHALDREIRDASGGVRGLDDVVRILFQQNGEVTSQRLRRIAEDLSGRDLGPFFRRQLG
jgi:predicted metalloprotease with PDZ domain